MKVIKENPELLKIDVPIEAEKIYSRKVTSFGNGAKIDFTKDFIGKDVLVVVLRGNGRKR
jgi:putative transposon-encoded protein